MLKDTRKNLHQNICFTKCETILCPVIHTVQYLLPNHDYCTILIMIIHNFHFLASLIPIVCTNWAHTDKWSCIVIYLWNIMYIEQTWTRTSGCRTNAIELLKTLAKVWNMSNLKRMFFVCFCCMNQRSALWPFQLISLPSGTFL